MEDDWKVTLMVSIKEWIQDNPSLFLPIVQSWSQDDRANLQVPKLRNVLNIENKEDLPQLFLYHTNSQTALKYPYDLDDP